MKIFWTCFVVGCLVFSILFLFFLAGLSDGTINSFNLSLWLLFVGVPAAVLLGGLQLRKVGRPGAATLLLAALAVPGLVVGGGFLLMIILFSAHPGAYR